MERDRLIAYVADIVLEQGGDWDATFAVVRNQLTGDDLAQGELFALWLLGNYEEPGLGAEVVRAMRDRRRGLIPAQPARPSGWRGWGGTRTG